MNHVALKTLLVGALLWVSPALAATPDGLLTSNTKFALWTTAGVSSTAVHVDTNDGIVTLYGKVLNTEQKAIAEKTAAGVGGVRAVKNLLQVVAVKDEKIVARSDKDLKEATEKQLKADPALKDSKIWVKSVDKGLVLLVGEAHTYSDHLRAVTLAYRVPGVARVATEVKGPMAFGSEEYVTFATPPGPGPTKSELRTSFSDMRISADVKMRLFTASNVPSTEINVDTDEGVVTLFGIVPTEAVKNAAQAEANKVSGVKSVENQLEVVASSQKKVVEAKDADLQKDLALVFKGRAEFKHLTTEVKNGTVRLTGTVSSGWDELNALRIVRALPGVRGVEDQLKIDEKIETSQR